LTRTPLSVKKLASHCS